MKEKLALLLTPCERSWRRSVQDQQGLSSLALWHGPWSFSSLGNALHDTRDLLLSEQVHLGWRRHMVIGFVSFGCSELTLISAVVDLV